MMARTYAGCVLTDMVSCLSYATQHNPPMAIYVLTIVHLCCAATCANGGKAANGNCNCPSGTVPAVDAASNFLCLNGELQLCCLLLPSHASAPSEAA